MATTTNYSWTTPDDTDLVKDGAAAIRTLGSSIDTSVKALSPGTTAGDIDYYTTSTAKARLGIGTAGQVLQVNSGATAPEWAAPAGGAGNLVEIATGTLSGASVTISSLSSYTELLLTISGCTNSTADGRPSVRINNNSGANYNRFGGHWEKGGNDFGAVRATGASEIRFLHDNTTTRTSVQQAYSLRLFNCKNAGFTTYDNTSSGAYGGGGFLFTSFKGVYSVSEAVSSLVIANSGGDWAGGTYTLWGA